MQDEKGVGLSNEEIKAEVDTFVFEGHDTTASGLSWTLYNLSAHPEHQHKCREEVDALYDQKNLEWRIKFGIGNWFCPIFVRVSCISICHIYLYFFIMK